MAALDWQGSLEGPHLSMNGPVKPSDISGPEGSGFGPAVLTLSALAVFLYYVRYILIPFVVAGALAFILSILVDFLTHRTRLPRAVIAATVFILLLGILGGIGYAVYPSIASEGLNLVTDLKGTLTKALNGLAKGGKIEFLGNSYDAAQLANKAQTTLANWIEQPGNLVTLAGSGFSLVFGSFLTAVLLFYFLLSGRQIVTSAVSLAPQGQRPLIWTILGRVNPVLQRYFIGLAVIVTYAGTAAYIGLGLILGIKHAILLAAATGFLELIPVVGPALSGVLAGLVALQGASSVWDVVKYIIYATALRLSIDQIIGPLVLGRASSLSPVTVIFCFLAGGILYGVAGVIMAVPVALTLRITLKTIHGEFEEEETRGVPGTK
jgi:predicted PurR-regulated permease PerM